MTDVFLYAGDATATTVILSDPTVPRTAGGPLELVISTTQAAPASASSLVEREVISAMAASQAIQIEAVAGREREVLVLAASQGAQGQAIAGREGVAAVVVSAQAPQLEASVDAEHLHAAVAATQGAQNATVAGREREVLAAAAIQAPQSATATLLERAPLVIGPTQGAQLAAIVSSEHVAGVLITGQAPQSAALQGEVGDPPAETLVVPDLDAVSILAGRFEVEFDPFHVPARIAWRQAEPTVVQVAAVQSPQSARLSLVLSDPDEDLLLALVA